eukprot:TRINITY_DN7700_c1_g1_i1.p1 TRINITY_DN7700_c1_g1~~TRINITY_DN7700_c1_g1_i1.p1  ORF type:complete len:231 (+),score=32.97 TRINITY_DN7700_c1_g1_i1:74-766(+)
MQHADCLPSRDPSNWAVSQLASRKKYYKEQAISIYGAAMDTSRKKKKRMNGVKRKRKPSDIKSERERLWCGDSVKNNLPMMYRDNWIRDERKATVPEPVAPRTSFEKLDVRRPIRLPILDNPLVVPVKPSTAKAAARLWMTHSSSDVSESLPTAPSKDPFDINFLSTVVFESKSGYPQTEFDAVPLMQPATTPTRNPVLPKQPSSKRSRRPAPREASTSAKFSPTASTAA